MMDTIPAQLLKAMEDKGWSVARLLRESKLKCDRSSLHRKLHGGQPLDPDEVQSLVNALGVNVVVVPARSVKVS